jgi:hypothetical protein
MATTIQGPATAVSARVYQRPGAEWLHPGGAIAQRLNLAGIEFTSLSQIKFRTVVLIMMGGERDLYRGNPLMRRLRRNGSPTLSRRRVSSTPNCLVDTGTGCRDDDGAVQILGSDCGQSDRAGVAAALA